MIKFNTHQYLTNMDGVTKDIIVKAPLPNKIKDAFIGGGLVLAGIVYLTSTAFRYGTEMFDEAETETMRDLHIIY